MRTLTLFMLLLACGCTKDITPPPATPYVRTIINISSLTQTSVVCYGNVEDDYGSEVFERGFMWSTSPPPYITYNYKLSGSGEGSFNAQITGLTRNRTYYVTAFATNNIGRSYGQTIYFTTPN